MSLVGIDIGTSGAKATVFDTEGRVIGQAYREYPLCFPKPGWIELDAARVIHDAHDALAEAARAARRDPITALSVSTLGEAAAPVDAAGRILDRAIIGFDTRGCDENDFLSEKVGRGTLFRKTGAPPKHIFTICKMLWLRKHNRALFRSARKFLLFEDLFFNSLGLDPVINYSLAARTMAFNIHKKEWDAQVLEAAAMDEGMFARPAASGAIVGEVPAVAASKLGLKRGVIAVAGGHDQLCAAFGSGVIKPGLACDSTGTVECVTIGLAEAVVNARMLRNNFCCSPHVVPGMYATLAYNFTGGSLLKWFRDTFTAAERKEVEKSGGDIYDVLLSEAPEEPTNLMVLPHFTSSGTPYFDPDSFGAMLGLKLETTRGEVVRAILEGVSMEIRMNIEMLKSAGVEVKELNAIGGGARSEYWLKLKADVFGRPVVSLDVSEAGALGAAMLAGIGAGVYKSYDRAVAAAVRKKKKYTPVRSRADKYTQRLEAYRAMYPALKKWAALLPENDKAR